MVFVWQPDPVIFSYGSFTLLWYGVFFALGLTVGGIFLYQCFRRAGISQLYYELLLVVSFIAILLGARLAHCLCYDPGYYLSRPIEIFLPVRQLPDGSFAFVGYSGLASHGGFLALIIGILLFCKFRHLNALQIMDYMAIVTPLVCASIRLGNFTNSEIIGLPTNGDWGVIFANVDTVPRHPAQLYEALAYLFVFVAIILIFRQYHHDRLPYGIYLSITLIAVPLLRFCAEFFKENQSYVEDGMALNLGQLLSLPFILCGIVMLIYLLKSCKKSQPDN